MHLTRRKSLESLTWKKLVFWKTVLHLWTKVCAHIIVCYSHQNLEKIHYNSALAITGAIRGTSKEKLCQELRLESLEKRRWYRKLCYFYKIFNKQSPTYLLSVIPVSSRSYSTRNSKMFLVLKWDMISLKILFFLLL